MEWTDGASCQEIYNLVRSRLRYQSNGAVLDGFHRTVFETVFDSPGYFVSRETFAATIGLQPAGELDLMAVVDMSPDVLGPGVVGEARCVSLRPHWPVVEEFQQSILASGQFLVDVAMIDQKGRWFFLKTLELSYFFVEE